MAHGRRSTGAATTWISSENEFAHDAITEKHPEAQGSSSAAFGRLEAARTPCPFKQARLEEVRRDRAQAGPSHNRSVLGGQWTEQHSKHHEASHRELRITHSTTLLPSHFDSPTSG